MTDKKKIKLKFKVGQYIRPVKGSDTAQVFEISEMGYHCDNAFVPFTAEENWELVEGNITEGQVEKLISQMKQIRKSLEYESK